MSLWLRSGAVQVMTSLDREKQEVYQLRVIAFDNARTPDHRPVGSEFSAILHSLQSSGVVTRRSTAAF